MKILYRTAEKKSKVKGKIAKFKPDYITNQNCLSNLYQLKGDNELIVFGDRLTPESQEFVIAHSDRYFPTTKHGNSQTFLELLDFVESEDWDSEEIVYFVEDDYLHRPGWSAIIEEGLKQSDYVSLYDHPDKYPGTSPLFLTKSAHWRYVKSTTMTFATKIKTLVFDVEVFREMCRQVEIPPDHYIFSFLTDKMHRRLATPIPAYSTHGETQWLSPFIDWANETK